MTETLYTIGWLVVQWVGVLCSSSCLWQVITLLSLTLTCANMLRSLRPRQGACHPSPLDRKKDTLVPPPHCQQSYQKLQSLSLRFGRELCGHRDYLSTTDDDGPATRQKAFKSALADMCLCPFSMCDPARLTELNTY